MNTTKSLREPEARVYLDDGEIAVDSFAGGGGASKGIELALGRGPHIAINHDAEAIALHKANHPESEHFTEDVWHVDPVAVCQGRPVGLMWLSPDCKHFSKAKGGAPVSPRVRGLAWVAVRWAKAVKPRIIILENVEEFQTWGPVDRETGRPCPRRRGSTFKRFVGRLRALGYTVEWRELRACDYGAPTIRKRLFLVARCDGERIVWPQPTHGKGRARPWRTAAECIDFSLPCPSIFARKKPLAENTLRRIGAGLRRFVFEAERPFIVGVGGRMGQSPPRSIDAPYQTVTAKADAAIIVPSITKFHNGAVGSALGEPMPTVTANSFIKRPSGAAPLGLVVPTLVEYHGAKRDGDDRIGDVDAPLPTQDTSNRFGLVEPFLVPMQHQNRPTSAEEPLQTITTQGNKFNIVAPVLVPRYGEDPDPRRGGGQGQAPRANRVDEPMRTIVPTGNGASLVAGFLAKHYGGHETPGRQLDLPISTLTTQDHHHLVTAHVAKHYGGRVGSAVNEPLHTVTAESVHHAVVASTLVNLRGTDESQLVGRSVEQPLPTISGGGIHAAEVRAFLVAYYGAEKDGASLFDPLRTLSAKDRFGLVTIEGVEYQLADIGMRMLAPRELYRAQGFPDSYKIDIPFTNPETGKTAPMTKTAQVRMCGNSVCPDVAAAIVRANVARIGAGERAA